MKNTEFRWNESEGIWRCRTEDAKVGRVLEEKGWKIGIEPDGRVVLSTDKKKAVYFRRSNGRTYTDDQRLSAKERMKKYWEDRKAKKELEVITDAEKVIGEDKLIIDLEGI